MSALYQQVSWIGRKETAHKEFKVYERMNRQAGMGRMVPMDQWVAGWWGLGLKGGRGEGKERERGDRRQEESGEEGVRVERRGRGGLLVGTDKGEGGRAQRGLRKYRLEHRKKGRDRNRGSHEELTHLSLLPPQRLMSSRYLKSFHLHLLKLYLVLQVTDDSFLPADDGTLHGGLLQVLDAKLSHLQLGYHGE